MQYACTHVMQCYVRNNGELAKFVAQMKFRTILSHYHLVMSQLHKFDSTLRKVPKHHRSQELDYVA